MVTEAKDRPKTTDKPVEKPVAEVKPETAKTPDASQEKLEFIEAMMSDALDQIATMGKQIDILNQLYVTLAASKVVTKSAPKFGGNRAPVKVLDTKTDELYKSKSACGRACAGEYGLDATNSFVYYEMVAKDPDRFVEQA